MTCYDSIIILLPDGTISMHPAGPTASPLRAGAVLRNFPANHRLMHLDSHHGSLHSSSILKPGCAYVIIVTEAMSSCAVGNANNTRAAAIPRSLNPTPGTPRASSNNFSQFKLNRLATRQLADDNSGATSPATSAASSSSSLWSTGSSSSFSSTQPSPSPSTPFASRCIPDYTSAPFDYPSYEHSKGVAHSRRSMTVPRSTWEDTAAASTQRSPWHEAPATPTIHLARNSSFTGSHQPQQQPQLEGFSCRPSTTGQVSAAHMRSKQELQARALRAFPSLTVKKVAAAVVHHGKQRLSRLVATSRADKDIVSVEDIVYGRVQV